MKKLLVGWYSYADKENRHVVDRVFLNEKNTEHVLCELNKIGFDGDIARPLVLSYYEVVQEFRDDIVWVDNEDLNVKMPDLFFLRPNRDGISQYGNLLPDIQIFKEIDGSIFYDSNNNPYPVKG